MKYIKKHDNHNIASLFTSAGRILHENYLGKNESFELILEPQHHLYSPAFENKPKTHDNV